MRYIYVLLFFIQLPFLTQGQEKVFVDLEAAYREGMSAMRANQFQKAHEAFYECYREDFKNQDLIGKLAYCNLRLGNYAESKLMYKQLLNADSTNISAMSNLAGIYEKELNLNTAKTYYEQLLLIDSSNSYYHRQYGFLLKRMKKPLKSILSFNKAHSLNPNDIIVIDELAQSYLNLEAYDYATQFAEKGLALDENNIRILYTSAKINSELNEDREVIRLINKAMALGDSTIYYQKVLSVSYLQVDSIDAAIFYLNRIINKKEASEHTHHYLALAYQKKGEIEKSIEHLEKAIELAVSKKAPRYHGDLAAIHETQEQYRKAIPHYQAAYNYSDKPRYLFFLARNQDLYYKDKKIAVRSYKKYLKTGHERHRLYAQDRIKLLNEIIHFQVKQ